MRIRILFNNQYEIIGNEIPEAGSVYELEAATSGTSAQNRAFHALISEYWKSGAHSYPAKSFDEFRDFIKRDLGAGFEQYAFVGEDENGFPIMKACKTKEEIPIEVRQNPRYNKMVRGRLKSWSEYGKKERRLTMDKLIGEMNQVGVNSKHYQEILEGMGALWE